MSTNDNGLKQRAAMNTVFGTLETFSYYMKSKSLFYELLLDLREMKCSCGKNIGEKFLLFLLKMYAGSTINVPAIEEIEYYKFMINNPEKVAQAYCEKKYSIEHILTLHLRTAGCRAVSEISLKEIAQNFMKVTFMLTDEEEAAWRKTRKPPERLNGFLKK